MKKTDLQASIKFSAKEFAHYQKDQFWYVGVGALILAVAAGTIWYRNYLLTAVTLAAGLAIIRVANFRPATHSVELTGQGVYWGEQFFGYHQLRAFWLAESEQPMLYLERLNHSHPLEIAIPAAKVAPAAQLLSKELPFHDQRREPIGAKVNRWFRI